MDDSARLEAMVRASPWFMEALVAARSLGLRSWCIGAGAVRNLVWDALQGAAEPSALSDIDLAYFDPREPPVIGERIHQDVLVRTHPSLPWEVTNQAHVHRWFEACFGHAVEPLRSLEAAVGTWPEFATAVAVTLDEADRITVIAPHGLDDLFAMRIRRNPARVSVQTFLERTRSKRYRERWPGVEIVLPELAEPAAR